MVIKSNDQLAHITCKLLSLLCFILKLLMLTTSALRDYEYSVWISISVQSDLIVIPFEIHIKKLFLTQKANYCLVELFS